jgi:hypothetical protein
MLGQLRDSSVGVRTTGTKKAAVPSAAAGQEVVRRERPVKTSSTVQ